MEVLKVAVVVPTELFSEGLQRILNHKPFEIVVVAKTLTDMISARPDGEAPDLIVFEADPRSDLSSQIAMFRNDSISALSLKIVIISEDLAGVQALGMEIDVVHALLSKNISGDMLRRSLELVALGQKIFPPGQSPSVQPDFPNTLDSPAGTRHEGATSGDIIPFRHRPPATARSARPWESREFDLSTREAEIIRRLVGGLPNKNIARDLFVSEATVKAHVKCLLRKVGARNRTQAAIWAVANGFSDNNLPTKYLAKPPTQIA